MRSPTKQLGVDASVRLAWSIANTEACLSGGARVGPAHLLLAALMILDDSFAESAERMLLSAADLRLVAEAAAESRASLEMTDEEVTSARRGLRLALRGGSDARAALPRRQLPQSVETVYVFQKAARHLLMAGGQHLTLAHVLDALLESLPQEAAHLVKAAPRIEPTSGPPPPRPSQVMALFGEPAAGCRGARPAAMPGPARAATPLLDEYGVDLTALARDGRLTSVVGRDVEMTSVMRYLQRTSKRNVLLTGPSGVGKTALVEGLAQRLADEGTPEFLRRLRVVRLNAGDLTSGAEHEGGPQNRLRLLLREAAGDPSVIVFIDDAHLLKVGPKQAAGAAHLFKFALAQDDLRCIVATGEDEYRRHYKDDADFLRHFHLLRLAEPTDEEALEICRGWARRIGVIQQVEVEEEAVRAAVSLPARVRGRALPEKAIDLLENAAAYVKISALWGDARGQTGAPPPRVSRAVVEEVFADQYGSTGAAD